MKTSKTDRRQRTNRRSGLERRWITANYEGPERRNGTDRRRRRTGQRPTAAVAPLVVPPDASIERSAEEGDKNDTCDDSRH